MIYVYVCVCGCDVKRQINVQMMRVLKSSRVALICFVRDRSWKEVNRSVLTNIRILTKFPDQAVQKSRVAALVARIETEIQDLHGSRRR
jgi:hypothetical protein